MVRLSSVGHEKPIPFAPTVLPAIHPVNTF
jgi:hypothetical protein